MKAIVIPNDPPQGPSGQLGTDPDTISSEAVMPRRSSRRSEWITHADVIHLAGEIDEAAVAAIIATNASYNEIAEAVKWANGDAEELGKSGRGLSAGAEAVYDILIADPAFAPEPDR